MDVHGLKHLENILYREDTLEGRIKSLYRWVNEDKDFTLDQFSRLVLQCNKIQVLADSKRKSP